MSCCVTESERRAEQLSIAEVRKALASLRRGWEEVRADPERAPLYLSSDLAFGEGLRLDDFALRFVLAHHQKRQSGAGG